MVRFGDQVWINGQDVYTTFGADLQSFRLRQGGVNGDSARQIGRAGLILHSQDLTAVGTLEMTFIVNGDTAVILDTRIGQLLNAVQGVCEINMVNRTDTYVSILQTYTVNPSGIDQYQIITFVFQSLRRRSLQTQRLDNGTGTLTYNGNVPSRMSIRIQPLMNDPNYRLTINGTTITINAVINRHIVIDGITGRVVDQNGVNRFSDTDLIVFPMAQIGTNTFSSSRPFILDVSWHPVFHMVRTN